MHDPIENKFVPVPEDESSLPREQRNWTRFWEGEKISLKGVNFIVHEIGESRMVLKLVKQ